MTLTFKEVAEILKIMGFWIQLGVSGFRMDAVPFVIAEKGADMILGQKSDLPMLEPPSTNNV